MTLIDRYEKNKKPDTVWDKEAHHQLAKKIESECAVLLKNDDILPLKNDDEVAFIGYFADHPRYQGGGSSNINATRVESALTAAKDRNVTYAQGFETSKDEVNDSQMEEAIKVAKKAKVAVIFAGLPDNVESESYDRSHLRLPNCQNALIEAVTAVQPNTIVVLHNGAPVEMPWIDKIKGLLEAYLGGQAVGGAVVDILYGVINPSGKLAETFPLKVEDNPSYLYYGGEKDQAEYREGLFVGYRYYDKKNMEVLFPFGHGLSYTTFEYSNLKTDKQSLTDQDLVSISLDVTNTGKVTGKEVVQIYVEALNSSVIRPAKELREFAKVELKPGETKTLHFTLGKRAFPYYNTQIKDWYVESGKYLIHAGSSSRDLREQVSIEIASTVSLPVTYHFNSTFGDIHLDPRAAKLIQPLLAKFRGASMLGNPDDEGKSENLKKMENKMFEYMPIRQILTLSPGLSSHDELQALIDQMNSK